MTKFPDHPDGVTAFDLEKLSVEGAQTILELNPTKFAMIEMSDEDTGEFQGFGLLRPGLDDGPLLLSFDQRVIETALIALIVFHTATVQNMLGDMNMAGGSSMMN